jgi:hypothetical protein
LAFMPLRAFFITAAIEWCNQSRGDFRRFFKNGVGRIGVDAVGEGRQARPQGRASNTSCSTKRMSRSGQNWGIT